MSTSNNWLIKIHYMMYFHIYTSRKDCLPKTEPACEGAMSWGLTRIPLLWKPQHMTAIAISTRADP